MRPVAASSMSLTVAGPACEARRPEGPCAQARAGQPPHRRPTEGRRLSPVRRSTPDAPSSSFRPVVGGRETDHGIYEWCGDKLPICPQGALSRHAAPPHPQVSSSRSARGPIVPRVRPSKMGTPLIPSIVFRNAEPVEAWVLGPSPRMTIMGVLFLSWGCTVCPGFTP